MSRLNCPKVTCCALVMAFVCGAMNAWGQQAPPQDLAGPADSPRISNFRGESPGEAVGSSTHPLSSVLSYARKEQTYLRRTLRDFSSRLIKRERIDGFLQDYNYIDIWVREQVRESGQVIVPLSVYMRFLGPAKVAGRQVLYVEGNNDGKMLVRNGGKHFDYVTVQVDPEGESAKQESLIPITKTGFNDLLASMIDVIERHVRADPSGANTQVTKTAGAKINKRPSTMLRIVHPRKQPGLEFHNVSVFIDDELHVPIRVEYYDWPKWERGLPQLVAEYTYTNLKINLGLTDASFDRSIMRKPAAPAR